MSDSTFTRPKTKPSIFWWLGCLIVGLLVVFLLQLFGPGPRIIASRQTTYVTEPLGTNGLPDYEKYLLQQYRDGVTPENNAAALIWPALWPGELQPSQYEAVAAELGLNGIPTSTEALQPIHKRVIQMLKAEEAAQSSARNSASNPPDLNAELAMGDPAVELDQRADELAQRIMAHPWTSKEFPDLSNWAKENQKPLDMLVAASARDHCYFPSPSLLNDKDESLIETLLPGVQTARETARSLTARAMWHLGEGRTPEAWRDLYAVHRIGRLLDQGQTLVEQLVGMAISNSASSGTLALLHEGSLTPAEARQILQDLSALKPFAAIADSVDHTERAMFADVITRMAQGKLDEKGMGLGNNGLQYLRYIAIDWNSALQIGNGYYDRFTAAARLPTYQARTAATDQLESEITNLARGIGPETVLAAVFSRSARSEAVGNIMVTMLLPALNAAMAAQDRQNTSLELLRLAAALAMFRAEHGTYPATLDELSPAILPTLPADLFGPRPFIYQRTADGYLLYSTGANGQDDGGSNESMRVFQGQPLDELGPTQAAPLTVPPRSDDISIRVPRPMQVPKPAKAADGE